MRSLKTVYHALLVVFTVLARITWIMLVTTVLASCWVVYNVVMFNVKLLFTRIPWRLKMALVGSYSRAVFEKALELSFLNMAKQATRLLLESRGVVTYSRQRRWERPR